MFEPFIFLFSHASTAPYSLSRRILKRFSALVITKSCMQESSELCSKVNKVEQSWFLGQHIALNNDIIWTHPLPLPNPAPTPPPASNLFIWDAEFTSAADKGCLLGSCWPYFSKLFFFFQGRLKNVLYEPWNSFWEKKSSVSSTVLKITPHFLAATPLLHIYIVIYRQTKTHQKAEKSVKGKGSVTAPGFLTDFSRLFWMKLGKCHSCAWAGRGGQVRAAACRSGRAPEL